MEHRQLWKGADGLLAAALDVVIVRCGGLILPLNHLFYVTISAIHCICLLCVPSLQIVVLK